MNEEYELKIALETAEIRGSLSLQHLFEMLNFLELQGFVEVEIDECKSGLVLHKDRSIKREEAHKEREIFFESLFELEKAKKKELEEEILIKNQNTMALNNLIYEYEQEQKNLIRPEELLKRESIINKLNCHPKAQNIIQKNGRENDGLAETD